MPFIFGSIAPILIAPFHLFIWLAYGIGGLTGWFLASHSEVKYSKGHNFLVSFIKIIILFSFLTNSIYGTFVIGTSITWEPSYDDLFIMNLAVTTLYCYNLKRLINVLYINANH